MHENWLTYYSIGNAQAQQFLTKVAETVIASPRNLFCEDPAIAPGRAG
jgi:hypothetical protein